MRNPTKENIGDEDENPKKYPIKTIVFAVLTIGILLMILAYSAAHFYNL
jgi:hypothetical protein